MKKRIIRFVARVMFSIMVIQLVVPATEALALTSGPTQPEVQSFEPVGTTDMVDIFSGDFNYNIPLMDVEGYPINIAYHSGATIEDESSWVGLGWNINPGEINRGVRGVPDDFRADTINKKLNIKEEKDYRFRTGINVGAEFLGTLNVGLGAGQYISFNNYRGMGVGMDVNASLSVPFVSTGIGMSVGSLEGADIDANASLNFSTSKLEAQHSSSISFSGSTGFNTRSGMKNLNYGVTVARVHGKEAASDGKKTKYAYTSKGGIGLGSSVPIGMQNYVAAVTNASTMKAWQIQVKMGLEAMYSYGYLSASMTKSTLQYDREGSMASYGYLNADAAIDNGIMDFSREKDGIYNNTLSNLPLSSMTYDLFSISAQGSGGVFRPFRNDIGSVYDPELKSTSNNKSLSMEMGAGIGLGGLFEFGTDVAAYRSRVESGPWFRRGFRPNSLGSLYEKSYFKQAGELTYSQVQDVPEIANHQPYHVSSAQSLVNKAGTSVRRLPNIYGALNQRSARANHLSFITNDEASIQDVTFNTKIENYPANSFIDNNAGIKYRVRTGANKDKAKGHHIGEMTQVLPDGRRYLYGIPAMNNIQREATFSVDQTGIDLNTGLVNFTPGTHDRVTNNKGRDNYYQGVYTPAYAHSYLLTSVLSSDYTDITGDGLTEDDLGSYTKFNYTLVDSDYRWMTPYPVAGVMKAQHNPGYWSDPEDDKGNIIIGSKQLWYVHSIETKNYIAEFHTSPKSDGRGVINAITNTLDVAGYDDIYKTNRTTVPETYKLDSIRLFNKHDRFLNKTSAVPIKTVIFAYNYELCKSVPNNSIADTGKLTLKRIYFKYGTSQKSLVNPYVFNYDESNNKIYNFAEKDRWGNYKPNDPALTNYEFPYVKQDKAAADLNSSSWQLTEIILPSGGRINVNYEADDYSYVQDKRSMEMFVIAGVGGSTNYDPRDILYENYDQPYDYIYFKRAKTREIAGRSMRQNYLENTDMLYFSFNLDIAARNKYEHIKGYAKVEDVGYCNGDANHDYGYIKVKRESAGGKSGVKVNPVALCGLNTGRYYLPHIIYPGYGGGLGDIEVLNGLMAATKELLTITQNANVRFLKDGLAKRFKPAKSWMRLHTPGYTKVGGGNRVKTLTLSDSWDRMATNGSAADYGRSYDYTTTLDNATKISSGVASYEPMVGGDENPLRQPVKYTADAGRLMPAIEFYQEEPFGESFYPSPMVGYSKVTVNSIHKDEGRSSKAEDVYEFYTAKDFPIEVDFTPKQTPRSEKVRSLTNKYEDIEVVQGYALKLNDMHGKAKSISNYAIKSNTSGNEYRELITDTKYNYRVDEKGKLSNKVKAVKRGDLVNPTYSIADMVLGEEVDFTVDNRRREMESQSINISFNLNVVNFLFVVVPIPTVFFPDNNETSIFKTMVATKIIQQYGILKSVEVTDHGARTTTENVLYDSETGQVLLTKSNNEFNDPITNVSYPAYWAYDRMGGSYFNTGYEELVDSMFTRGNKAYLPHVTDKYRFNTGDELLLRFVSGGAQKSCKVWVTGIEEGSIRFLDTCWRTPPPTDGSPWMDYCYDDSSAVYSYGTTYWKSRSLGCVLAVEPRAAYPTGDTSVIWIADNSKISNVSVKVLRSGRRNMLGSSVQNTTLATNFAPTSFTDLFSASAFGSPTTSGQSSVIASSATTFTDYAFNNEFAFTGPGAVYKFNKIITGEAGNFRPESTYGWMAPRRYASNHARKDGLFDVYKNLWLLDTPSVIGCGSLDSRAVGFIPHANWKQLSKVISYNSYGLPTDESDAAGIRSSAIYGNNFSLPLAVASNAKSSSVKYFGFEDLLQLHNDNRTKLGIWETIKVTANPTTYVNTYGKKYGILTAGLFGANTSISTEAAHTGKYSMKTTGAASILLGSNTDYTGVGYGYISMWVKSTTGAAPTLSSFKIQSAGPAVAYTVFNKVSNPIDGWYKIEGKFSMPPSYTTISLTLPTGFYVDDIRLAPDNANMKSFAYDFRTFRLMAELDENNFATFYEYDQEGALIRVKKETERGILTVNEHRKSNAKHVQ